MISDMPLEDWGFVRYGIDKGESIQNLYKTEWKKYTGKDYVSNTTAKNNLVTAFGTLATDRNDCYKYHCSCHGDGTDNSISCTSYSNKNEVIYGKSYLKIYRGRPVPQTNQYEYIYCETTAFFMQYLARLTSKKDIPTAMTILSAKYDGVEKRFYKFFGMMEVNL